MRQTETTRTFLLAMQRKEEIVNLEAQVCVRDPM